jgi:circadian clock protein KaiC
MSNDRLRHENGIAKCRTGIRGLDEITEGGLPRGKPTLVCGGPGCGKTVLGMEFLVSGATQYDEPGVFFAFEETPPELNQNFATMNFDVARLCAHKKLYVEHVEIKRHDIEEAGEYDLTGLFVRLQKAIDSVGAKRMVLDTVEFLFSGFRDSMILRAELRRLFQWVKERNLTTIVTAESGNGQLTRHGLEEYVADCVIALDNRVNNLNTIRHLRVVKYRGSAHGNSEYPFIITGSGFSVLPLSLQSLTHKASNQRVPSGIRALDEMLDGKGFFRASSILVSGSAGTGKSSIAAHFVHAACQRGERAVLFASEQSQDEISRNMRSIGIDLEPWVKKDLLRFYTVRTGSCGLEKHLVLMHDAITAFSPKVVVIDPISNYGSIGTADDVKSMLTRLLDMFKSRNITAMFTSLIGAGHTAEDSIVGMSSLMDTWLLLENLESNGERTRGLNIMKSHGMAHSNQIREFRLTNHGAQLVDVYVGPRGVLTGSARELQGMQDRAAVQEQQQELARKRDELNRKRQQMEAQIAGLRSEFEVEEQEVTRTLAQTEAHEKRISRERVQMGQIRQRVAARRDGNGRVERSSRAA